MEKRPAGRFTCFSLPLPQQTKDKEQFYAALVYLWQWFLRAKVITHQETKGLHKMAIIRTPSGRACTGELVNK